MKDIQSINWDLENGIVPSQFKYIKPIHDRERFINHFARGFMNLPNADAIIDKMMFYAKLNAILQNKSKAIQ
jgi:hypothetical protein